MTAPAAWRHVETGYNQGVEYSDAITDMMLSAPRQAVLLAGSAAFGSTDRMEAPLATPCVETTWRRNHHGYGRAQRDGRRVLAHRYAWEQERGPIPDGLFVLHRCDNPPCINVAHLFLGTLLDNNRDRWSKGRDATGDRKNAPKGVAHRSARLSDADVATIRLRAAAGEAKAALAREFGVSKKTVIDVASGRLWRHLPGPLTPPRRTPPEASPEVVLTARRMKAEGMTEKAIGEALGRSRGTVHVWVTERPNRSRRALDESNG